MSNFSFKSASIAVLAMAAVGVYADASLNVASGPCYNFQGDPGNFHASMTATGGFAFGTANILGGTLDHGTDPEVDFTYALEAMMFITSPEHPGVYSILQPFPNTTTYSGSLSLPTGLMNTFGTMQNASIASGDHFDVEFFEDYDDSDDPMIVESTYSNLSVNFVNFTPPQPPSYIDLGTMGSVERTDSYGQGETKWFKIHTTTTTDSTLFLNIHTRNTTNFLGGSFADNDTEIGVYDVSGTLIDTNDDEDFGGGVYTSFLDYGADSGFELAAGDYYIAVGGFNMTFDDEFSVINDSVASGDIVFTIESNLPGGTGGGNSISGHMGLQDLAVSPAGQSIQYELRNIFGPVASGTTSLDGSGNYHINFASSLTGTYTLWVKGSTWLAATHANITLGTDVTGIDYSLKNGDVDGDNEVALADFGVLSDAFGSFVGDPTYAAGADLDQDGEVGLADFGILSSNFGEIGD